MCLSQLMQDNSFHVYEPICLRDEQLCKHMQQYPLLCTYECVSTHVDKAGRNPEKPEKQQTETPHSAYFNQGYLPLLVKQHTKSFKAAKITF